MDLPDLLHKKNYSRDDIIDLLSLTDADDVQALYDAAYAVKAAYVGRVVYYRGLIEFSNRCIKNCCYCGIRRDNRDVERFDTDRDDILAMAKWTYDNGYGSLTLQSGERQDDEFIAYIEGLLRDIKKLSDGGLGITLCVGEQTEDTYRRWFEAGAHRYLLRIETSNPALYATLHPQDGHHQWSVRKECLNMLHRLGYQVGTGDMIGLPGQTLEDLADDILFYRDMDIAMIGMGPYVVHHNTPVGKQFLADDLDTDAGKLHRLHLGLKMIAVTRLVLKDVNIASTTALQALHPFGRELGLKAGANILMPIVTVPKFRSQYLLYDNKPCVDEVPAQCKDCLRARVASVGDTVGLGKWGDSPHFFHHTHP
ncbi:MAG: [FeFe] hydrogenase H-cluster radical SAM maturase HydE [Megasphaera sp.]|jgi:biotin synthase|nr:[FeFe] hydrogenase H-cluster radical SAM maturase HydE [Megasphaera sp.]